MILFAILSLKNYSQDFKYHIGLGLDLDMGVRIDDNLAPYHQLEYRNSALASSDIFTKLSYKGFNFAPEFRISWATFGKGKRTAINEAGQSIPEGNYISLYHSGDFQDSIERGLYLLDKSNVTVTLTSVGFFITYDFFKGKSGSLESGTGFFYNRKQVNFKEFMAHDVYDYFGSTGSHTSQYQTDEYVYKDTKKEKKPKKIQRMYSNIFSMPAIIQYNFNIGDRVILSPALVAYIGRDSYYEIRFSVGWGKN